MASDSVSAENVKKRIDWVHGALQFQQANGLVTRGEAEEILKRVRDARSKLENDLPGADYDARGAQILLTDSVNSKGRLRKLLSLYFLPVWLLVGGIATSLILLLIRGPLRPGLLTFDSGGVSIQVSGDVILWGGLGGSAFSIYYLRKLIFELQLSKYFAIYLVVYPLAGMIFGLALVVLVAGGLLTVQGTPGYAVLAGVAFLGGMLQEWAIETLRDVAEAIHKTERS